MNLPYDVVRLRGPRERRTGPVIREAWVSGTGAEETDDGRPVALVRVAYRAAVAAIRRELHRRVTPRPITGRDFTDPGVGGTGATTEEEPHHE